MTLEEVATGRGVLRFRLRHAKRRTLAIHVHPDGEVEAVAPLGTDLDRVRARVAARAGWIARQLVFFEGLRPRTPPRRYVSGETYLYLGRRYRLLVHVGSPGVALRGGQLVVSAPKKSPEAVAAVMAGWYRARAAERFATRLREISVTLRVPEAQMPRLRLRRMRTRWGSLSPGGVMTLNPDLIRAPVACIDYVVVHEITHLDHPRHDTAFWHLLARRMPGWQERKLRLEMLLA